MISQLTKTLNMKYYCYWRNSSLT